MSTTTNIQAIGISLTFLVSGATLIYTVFNSKKTLFINTITSQRVKWIDDLREIISEFISLISLYEEKYIKTGADLSQYLDTVVKLETKIKLYLKYSDDRDKRIMGLVERLSSDTKHLYSIAVFLSEHAGELATMEAAFKEDPEAFFDYHDFDIEERNEFIKTKTNEYRTQIYSDVRELTEEVQVYLNDEWILVKREANKGDLSESRFSGAIQIGSVILIFGIAFLIIA